MLDMKGHAEFWHINLCPVIQTGIKALQYRLWGQVQLENKEKWLS